MCPVLFAVYLDQQNPTSNPNPITNKIKDKFDQIRTCSLVSTPKISPKIAGANAELGPSEMVGVTKSAKTIIQSIPPTGFGKRDIKRYQHHNAINVPVT